MAVRTKLLAAGSVGSAGSPVVVYTCPAGETTIVKDVRLSNSTGAGVNCLLFLVSGPLFVRLFAETIPAQEIRGMMPWCVLEPGQQLAIELNAASGIRHWLSGTQLEGVAD